MKGCCFFKTKPTFSISSLCIGKIEKCTNYSSVVAFPPIVFFSWEIIFSVIRISQKSLCTYHKQEILSEFLHMKAGIFLKQMLKIALRETAPAIYKDLNQKPEKLCLTQM